MQHVFKTAWFYSQLSCAIFWNSLVFSIRLHFTTRSFMSVFGVFICFLVLLLYRLLTWQTAYFSNTRYSVPTAVKSALIDSGVVFNERLCTNSTCQTRQESLSELLRQQPTHRDVLINLLLVPNIQLAASDATGSVTTTIRRFDPNHPLVARLNQ